MGMGVSRFEIYLVNLDPTVGSEIKKARPCLIISPDDMNQYCRTVIIAPMTTKGRNYPSRVSTRFQGKNGQIVLDQIRTVDRVRLARKMGQLASKDADLVLDTLQRMFSS
jgi:mRNA interferase MazF